MKSTLLKRPQKHPKTRGAKNRSNLYPREYTAYRHLYDLLGNCARLWVLFATMNQKHIGVNDCSQVGLENVIAGSHHALMHIKHTVNHNAHGKARKVRPDVLSFVSRKERMHKLIL